MTGLDQIVAEEDEALAPLYADLRAHRAKMLRWSRRRIWMLGAISSCLAIIVVGDLLFQSYLMAAIHAGLIGFFIWIMIVTKKINRVWAESPIPGGHADDGTPKAPASASA